MYVALQILILIIGFVCLVKGADIFVDGSSALARNFNIPGLIIGLTIVALGTSAPELAVSTLAAFQGSNEIALSNVIGSNIFNLLGVLGICAVIYPLPVDKSVLKRDFPVSIAATVFLLASTSLAFLFGGHIGEQDVSQEIGMISRRTGLVLLVLFAVYTAVLIYMARNEADGEDEEDLVPLWKCAMLIIVGLALIIAGGHAVVYSAKNLALAAGMTETLIGLTIVAIGTSLPELVTSVVAARKGETDLAIGNVIGSNIFNIMFILGISSMINPIAVNVASVYDMTALLCISMLAFVFSLTSTKIVRMEGLVMVAVYAANVVFAIIR